ncbi:MAG: integrase [Aigarchaeota archaeon]|nr:integrase [Candidatus Calditenuaceae archaeon]
MGLEPTICGLGGIKKPPAGFLTTSSTPVIDWDGFARYIFSEYSRRHARDLLLYARRYGHHLIRRDLSQLLHLPPNKRRHVLMALSALSKYLGCYDEFRRLRETYGIKWAVSDVVPAIVLDQNAFTNMLVKAREMLQILLPWREVLMFMALSGLRVEEALNAIKIYHGVGKDRYLNAELGILEHFRFPEVFIRRTKHAYITVVNEEILRLLEKATPVTYEKLRSYFKRRSHSRYELHIFRKIWATYMRCEGIDSEAIDLLQGRISRRVFTRYYYRPDLRPLLDQIRAKLNDLWKLIQN